MTARPDAASWRLVMPVKGGAGAKSRLRAPAGVDRKALARAFALDTVAAAVAALGPGRVYAVTGSASWREQAADLGAVHVPDPGGGLNAAIRLGLRHAEALAPEQTWLGVVLADLPAVRPQDLAAALAAAADHPRAVVPDYSGVGTVLLTAGPGKPIEPAFGRDSAARHEARGHVRLDLDLPRLRTDVDDAAALVRAVALGVGRHTAAVLERAR